MNYLRYISHLDLVRLFHRSFNRSQIPIKHSEGFNPHPKFSIANPLSLGIESEEEYMDIELEKDINIDEFIQRVNNGLPADIRILKAVIKDKQESVNSKIEWAFYEIKFQMEDSFNQLVLQEKLNEWIQENEIMITRMKKKGKTKVQVDVNIKPFIGNIIVKGMEDDNFILINTLLKSGENGNLKPIDFIEAIKRDLQSNIDMDSVMIKRIAQYAEENGNIYSPL